MIFGKRLLMLALTWLLIFRPQPRGTKLLLTDLIENNDRDRNENSEIDDSLANAK